MKKIYEIYELLSDILIHVRSLDRKCDSKPLNSPSDKQLATFLASNPLELQRVFREIAETPAPPIELGEFYIVKVFKRSF